jgi:hypothetical protein
MSAEECHSVVELLDHVCDARGEFAQNQDDVLSADSQSRFIEGYLKGEQCIALRRTEKFTSSEAVQDGFTIQAAQRFRAANSHPRRSHDHKAQHVRDCGYQALVFSQNVELVKGPNGFIPSFVRIERFDRSSFVLGQPLFSFAAINPSYRVDHFIEGVEDWKVTPGIRFFAIACGDASRKKIKAATERVENSAHPRVEREWQGRLLNSYYDIAIRLRISLAGNEVGMAPLPLDQALLNEWDLGYGPINAGLSV